ncbi:hypothetical protein [Bradyrhizobium sp. F1.13.3]|uniref:hypothetical protein n=1 Tax=Bradyrhizobium sp. F1.13.3 TaxID=3156351 RepID=UPI00339854C8
MAPASATSTVPAMVWFAWFVGPPALEIVMVGAVVSIVTALLAVVPMLPAVSMIRVW